MVSLGRSDIFRVSRIRKRPPDSPMTKVHMSDDPGETPHNPLRAVVGVDLVTPEIVLVGWGLSPNPDIA